MHQPDLQSQLDISMCGQSEEILHACCKCSRGKLVKFKDVNRQFLQEITTLTIKANSTNTQVQYCGGTQRESYC